MQANELFTKITDQIIADIEAGAGTWKMPWHRLADVGTPLSTDGRPYKGLNAYVLGSTCALNAWKSATFGTYRGWQRHGAQVRRGELGTAVILWKPITPGTKNADAEGGDEQHAGRRLIARAFTVFAAEQVDGAEKLLASRSARPERDTVERIVEADRYFAAIGATVIEGGNRAYYSPADDSIHLPELHQFDSAPAAYSTKSHEFSHWSGHPDRLARDLSGRFGSDAYAAEELVAELAAAMWSAQMGISTATRADHASYLASWLKILRADPRALVTVASKAQAAIDYLNVLAGYTPQPVDMIAAAA